ncbi:copper resistance protein CopC [Streptomyces sp. NPDC060366]|uniref:copper resistance protein CopC n=1 Tax=Streptomyces sp. NPDC060366 TaxID=3347105 RepID=UPI003668C251
MHAVNRSAARVAARRLVVPLAAAPLLFAARPAFAHTELVTGSPAEAAFESRPPQTIELTFSDAMTARYAKVALTAPDGEQGAAGSYRYTVEEAAAGPATPAPGADADACSGPEEDAPHTR